LTRNSAKSTPAESAPPAQAVTGQLERILSSTEFRRSERVCRFLRLITEEALNGSDATLKEYRIGVEVFDPPPSMMKSAI
jgi:hypothetical protein